MIYTVGAKRSFLQGLMAGLNKTGDYATLIFYGSGSEVVCTVTLDNPAGVITSNGVDVALTFRPSGEFIVTTSGNLATAKVFADDSTLMLDELSVGEVGTDIIVDKTAVQAGGLINISEFVIKY